jgi:fatty acid desaturase
MWNKYRINQIVFWLSWVIFSCNLYFLSFQKSWWLWALQFLISTICLHYFCNLSHIASHQMLSRNKKLNHIFGWFSALPVLVFSYIDFKISHQAHHKHTTDENLDPDHKITNNGSIFWLPFRIIIYKDGFFLNDAISKNKTGQIVEYTLQRIIQFSFFIWIILNSSTGLGFSMAYFYILPLLIVGTCNALFLYYYPHYQNQIEHWARSKFNLGNKITISFWVGATLTWLIDLSRIIHQAHHDKVLSNSPYYPEFWLWQNKFLNQTQNWRYLSSTLQQK